MKVVRITADWYESGNLRFAAGTEYPVDDDTRRQVDLQNGEIVDAEDFAFADVAAPAPAGKKAKG